jgi:lipopolysaccharide biosynthesis regulator YciM
MQKHKNHAAREPQPFEQTMQTIRQFVDAGNIDAALALLRNPSRDPHLRNALGVCMMRRGNVDEAVRLYRDLVLEPGCTWMKRDQPIEFKLNFATALLLHGRPSGCLAMLSEANEDQHPGVMRLRSAVKAWEATLGWWEWLNWKTGRIDPHNRPVPIDFALGEIVAPTETVEGAKPKASDKPMPSAA